MAKKNEIRLGQLLVQKKLCSLQQVKEALGRQGELRQRNENCPLGKILIDTGKLDEETLLETLSELGVLQLHCPICRVDRIVTSYKRDTMNPCSRCHEPLIYRGPAQAESERAIGEEEEAPIPVPARKSGSVRASKTLVTNTVDPGIPGIPAEDLPRAPADLSKNSYVGKVLGGCKIESKVAQGGMGVVYKAKQLNLGRTVAVKVLTEDLAQDKNFVRRFIQEARSAAQLSHGNIVHINDVGEYQGVYYFIMEYVDGDNLREILKNFPNGLEVARAMEIILQVCQALRHAHNRGIIHRDIKPENIMITREGVVKLADLGLAKRMAPEHSAAITHAGSILGTPFYMAPEQAKDFSAVDMRSDIYSLGVTLYKMLSGKVPFEGRSPIEVMIKAIDGKKTPLRELRAEVPVDLEAIVDKMMHKVPDERYQDVGALLEDLQRVLVVA